MVFTTAFFHFPAVIRQEQVQPVQSVRVEQVVKFFSCRLINSPCWFQWLSMNFSCENFYVREDAISEEVCHQ